jgi:hypothetical protein
MPFLKKFTGASLGQVCMYVQAQAGPSLQQAGLARSVPQLCVVCVVEEEVRTLCMIHSPGSMTLNLYVAS